MMNKTAREKEFEKLVKNKFNVYNSLFLDLPFQGVSNIGMFIPLLHHACQNGLEKGIDPQEILDAFFNTHGNLGPEAERIDFMFRVIQYVERQVVLFDSVEDAAFSSIQKIGDDLSIKDFIHLAKSKDLMEEILNKLASFSARIVLTAHPTQFYPPSVLDIITKLRILITQNDINGIDLSLQQLGLTSFINTKKPTPFDEAKNIIYFLRNVYYDAIGKLYSSIKKDIPGGDFSNPNIIKLGFWPGGDRDGNPYVTAEITQQVANELRMTLMKCYYQDATEIGQKLTFREVEETIADLRDRLYISIFDPQKPLRYDEIIAPLEKVRDLIIKKYNGLYLDDLESFIDKARIFKTHFATLDIRQDHSIHKQVMEAILKKENLIAERIDELTHHELVSIILKKEIVLDPDMFEEEIIRDTIQNIVQLKQIQARNGEDGCNRYIISNSEDIFSVLFVMALFRWSGWDIKSIRFDIVPLFETMYGMQSSEATMRELFDVPEYREHIGQRQNKQTIMLGFSDGTKDGGYLQANWSIFKTKETLSGVCDEYGTKALFFDGRGGPPARGGGKTHRFYAAQSHKIANHEIQLTIQGQTITSKYGTKEHFIHNCEQLLTAGLSNRFFENENHITDESRQLMENLASISFKKYTDLKNHPQFIPYLENKSTLKYYGQANIGSRPAKRGGKSKLELQDLRAISFVGSWSQLKQNVPGYFGIGSAIHSLKEKGKINKLQKLFKEVPFFKALILNAMMSLSKSNFNLTRYMAKDEEYKDFWDILWEEYKLSVEMVLLISGYSMLMEEEPVARKSIEIRERIVLPLLVIQQYALQKIEQKSSFDKIYQKIVKRSLYGNINASRNSA